MKEKGNHNNKCNKSIKAKMCTLIHYFHNSQTILYMGMPRWAYMHTFTHPLELWFIFWFSLCIRELCQQSPLAHLAISFSHCNVLHVCPCVCLNCMFLLHQLLFQAASSLMAFCKSAGRVTSVMPIGNHRGLGKEPVINKFGSIKANNQTLWGNWFS